MLWIVNTVFTSALSGATVTGCGPCLRSCFSSTGTNAACQSWQWITSGRTAVADNSTTAFEKNKNRSALSS